MLPTLTKAALRGRWSLSTRLARRRLLFLLLCAAALTLLALALRSAAGGLERRRLGWGGSGKLVFAFAHFFPPNADYGSDLRLLALLAAVVERGHDVWFIAPQAGRPEDLARLEALIGADRTLLLTPAGGLSSDSFALAPPVLPARVDVLVVAVWFWFRPAVFAQLVPLYSRLWPQGRLLALSDDCHHARQALIANQAGHTGDKFVGREAPSALWLLAQERAYYARSDWVVFVSERDRALCSRNISVLAWKGRVARTGPHAPPAAAAGGQLAALRAGGASDEEARNEVVFLGRADNPTNFVAVQNFLAEVWPAVRAALPRLRLVLVGAACEPHEACFWTKGTQYEGVDEEQSGVVVAGFAPRLADALAGRLALLMPIFWSTGVNTKFFRALEFGLPTLITPVSARSLELGGEEGRPAIVGRSPIFVCAGLADCWVDRLRELAGNATLRAEMGDAAAALGARLFEADEERRDFADLLTEVEAAA